MKRNTRERGFALALSIVILATLSQIIFFNPLSTDIKNTKKAIALNEKKMSDFKNQINALEELAKSSLYKKWASQREEALGMKYHYKSLLRNFSVQNWRDIIKATIKDDNRVQLVKIQILPEKKYTSDDISNIEGTIYEQKMKVSLLSDYFDTINYINDLKTVLPHIYWDNFNYKVVQYPIASVDMEFSVFYEKDFS